MRIISGQFKGRTIEFLKNFNTRPLKDSVKENIFNVIDHSREIMVKLKNSNVLDLYSGVGSFGLECISRGADNVTFVENNPKTLKILKRNIIKLSNKNAVVFESKIENFLQANNKKKYEIIFFDPPFSDEEFIVHLGNLRKNNLFKQNHLIIIHREKKSNDNLKSILKVIKIKKYGRSKIIFGNFI